MQYADGDIIRVYKVVYLALKLLELYLVISQENDNMDDDDKLDYMKNTGFKVSNDGLIAKV